MQNNCDKKDVEYAGFWARLGAYAIDQVIVCFLLLFVRLFLTGILSLAKGTALEGNLLFDYTFKDIVLYVSQVMYFILFLYGTGTTPGKRLMNLRVISAQMDEKLSFMDILYRETVGRFLSGIIMGAGYLFIGVDKEKRGLHDMLCDTRVIYGKKVKVYPVFQGPPNMQAPYVPNQITPEPDIEASRNFEGPYRMVRPEETEERNS